MLVDIFNTYASRALKKRKEIVDALGLDGFSRDANSLHSERDWKSRYLKGVHFLLSYHTELLSCRNKCLYTP